jgi:hypothetical protein
LTTIVWLISNLAVKLDATSTRARLNNQVAELIVIQYDILLPTDGTTIPFRPSQCSVFVLQAGGDVESKSHGHQKMYKTMLPVNHVDLILPTAALRQHRTVGERYDALCGR